MTFVLSSSPIGTNRHARAACRWVPEEWRSRSLTAVHGCYNIGNVAALCGTPLLVTSIGWPWALRVFALAGLVWAVCHLAAVLRSISGPERSTSLLSGARLAGCPSVLCVSSFELWASICRVQKARWLRHDCTSLEHRCCVQALFARLAQAEAPEQLDQQQAQLAAKEQPKQAAAAVGHQATRTGFAGQLIMLCFTHICISWAFFICQVNACCAAYLPLLHLCRALNATMRFVGLAPHFPGDQGPHGPAHGWHAQRSPLAGAHACWPAQYARHAPFQNTAQGSKLSALLPGKHAHTTFERSHCWLCLSRSVILPVSHPTSQPTRRSSLCVCREQPVSALQGDCWQTGCTSAEAGLWRL